MRIAFENNTKLSRKRLSRLVREAGHEVVGGSAPYDIFVTSQAHTDLSPDRLEFEKRRKEDSNIRRVDEYAFYADVWNEGLLANLVEEKLEGPLSNKAVYLVGKYSEAQREQAAAAIKRHHGYITENPDKANLFVLGRKSYDTDPEVFRKMLLKKSRLPYTKIVGRQTLMEKGLSDPSQKKKEQGMRLYSGRPNSDTYPERYVALDLEATSDRRNNKFIEIGLVRFDKGRQTGSYQSFVNPHERLRPIIIDLTGIRDEMLEDAPDIQGIQKDILKFLKDDPVVGHSVQNDMALLAGNLNLPLDNNYIDTCKIAMTMMPEREKFSLRSLADDLGLTRSTHRAYDDAVTSCELLEKFRILFAPDK